MITISIFYSNNCEIWSIWINTISFKWWWVWEREKTSKWMKPHNIPFENDHGQRAITPTIPKRVMQCDNMTDMAISIYHPAPNDQQKCTIKVHNIPRLLTYRENIHSFQQYTVFHLYIKTCVMGNSKIKCWFKFWTSFTSSYHFGIFHFLLTFTNCT